MTDPIVALPSVFFAYPSKPEMRRETIQNASAAIGATGLVVSQTWEELAPSGRIVIAKILKTIDKSGVVVCDTTLLNPNVLFELGYAIGRRKPVWLVRDAADALAPRAWKKFGLLRSVGYSKYVNSHDILTSFVDDRPERAGATLFDDLIGPSLTVSTPTSVFYFKSPHDNEPSRSLTRAIEDVLMGRSIVSSDPLEGAFKPLGWYAQELFNTRAAIVHLAADNVTDAEVHNARCALVAGLAHGMDKPLLMLAGDHPDPAFDYQDLFYPYRNARDCERHSRDWLLGHLSAPSAATADAVMSRAAVLASDLKTLRLGSHIAEEERATISDYFVETRNYHEVLSGATTIFVGRRGCGKTANFLRAGIELANDRRNLVCLIKPQDYELKDVVRLLVEYQGRDQKGYMLESLWRYLVLSEIARAAAAEIRERLAIPTPGTPEARLLDMADDPDGLLHEEFAVRLERVVRRLLEVPDSDGVEAGRIAISEAIHAGAVRDLRQLLGEVLSGRQRIAILVDNLDKGWDRESDSAALGSLVVSLLNAMVEISSELARRDHWRQGLAVSLAVFLRADIFSAVIEAAPERDKLPVSELSWSDPELLLRVVEDRFAASENGTVDGSEVWTRYFCDAVAGESTRTWIAHLILPRPRDLVYLCNAAITNAVNRGRNRVEEIDLLDAAEDYSQWAFESIVVEGEVTIAGLEEMLYEFVGVDANQSESDIRTHIDSLRSTGADTSAIIDFLVQVSFLGPLVNPNEYEFLHSLADQKRIDVMARKTASDLGRRGRSFLIHPAFWKYLEIAA